MGGLVTLEDEALALEAIAEAEHVVGVVEGAEDVLLAGAGAGGGRPDACLQGGAAAGGRGGGPGGGTGGAGEGAQGGGKGEGGRRKGAQGVTGREHRDAAVAGGRAVAKVGMGSSAAAGLGFAGWDRVRLG